MIPPLNCFNNHFLESESNFTYPSISRLKLSPLDSDMTVLNNYFQDIYVRMSHSQSKSSFAYTGDINKLPNFFEDNQFSWLQHLVENQVLLYVRKYFISTFGFTIFHQKSWPVLFTNGQSVSSHCHNNAHLSAIFYVDCPVSSTGGDIIFSSPFNCFPSINPLLQSKLNLRLGIRPFSNLLLIFPSTFLHEVTAYHGATPRFSISFDFFISASDLTSGEHSENLAPDPRSWSPFVLNNMQL